MTQDELTDIADEVWEEMTDALLARVPDAEERVDVLNLLEASCKSLALSTAQEVPDQPIQRSRRDAVNAELHQLGVRWNKTWRRIGELSLEAIALLCAERFPTASYVKVDVTDQDTSGALVLVGLLDADDNEIDYTDESDDIDGEPFEDAIWAPLNDLSNGNKSSWEAFVLTTTHGRPDRLDLAAIHPKGAA